MMKTFRDYIDSAGEILEHLAQQWRQLLLLVALLLLFSVETPPPASMEARVNRQLAGKQFDFARWEVRALGPKLSHSLVSPQRYLSGHDRRDFVLGYLALLKETHRMESEIHRVYADPDVEDPDAATGGLRASRAELRREIKARQPLAEAILEEQVASILMDEGFGLLGQQLPPVKMHFTPLPLLLVISPRDHIERTHQLSLMHGLDLAQQERIEETVDSAYDISSLITTIGGLSAYPSMLLESGSLNWVTEVTAHEWTHHYLAPRPLGRNYLSSAETRTINETAASIVGREVGRKLVARFYPEHSVPEFDRSGEASGPEGENLDLPEFDFRMEMRETRIRVDQLLAEGEIEEAEAYMERRRERFVEQGYAIRKLNQAYFAFHGAYADEPGAAGDDPIGPAVRELHARSPDLHTFVNRVARVTTLQELESLLDELAQPPSPETGAVRLRQRVAGL